MNTHLLFPHQPYFSIIRLRELRKILSFLELYRQQYRVRRKFFIDNLLVLIVMIGWTGLAPWEFEFPLPGSLTSTFLGGGPKYL